MSFEVTPAQAREMLVKIPSEWRDMVRRGLLGAWGDGFQAGVARLPRMNPFDTEPPPSIPEPVTRPDLKRR